MNVLTDRLRRLAVGALLLGLSAGCDAASEQGNTGPNFSGNAADSFADTSSGEGSQTGGGGGGFGYEPGSNNDWGGGSDTASPASDSTGGWSGWGGAGADASSGGPGSPGGGSGPNGECIPDCAGRQCGPDACGGTCGWCGGDDSCQLGVCLEVPGCKPACAGQMVGIEDGCGGVCSGSGLGIGLVPGGAQDASYFRKMVLAGEVPSPDVLPIEGWLTEHGTPLPPPLPDRFVSLHGFAGLFYDPAQGAPTVALQLGMNSAVPQEVIEANHFNLSLVVDVSGSMDGQDKMVFVRQGLLQLIDTLSEEDMVSIVTYSTDAKTVFPPQRLKDKAKAKQVIEAMFPGGSTNLSGGLKLGYENVLTHIADTSLTPRVILLSDGVPTAGILDTPSILAMSKSFNDVGVGLTTIGVGADINFDLMHLLATQGLGNFYFLDTADKITQVFEAEIKYLLTPVANNLKIWFSLPTGFGVDAIYGFEYKLKDGSVHLLGPSPQYDVDEGGVIEPPQPSEEQPDVAVSTVFAAKKNGLLMVKLQSPQADLLKDMENAALTKVYYEYELVKEKTVETFTTDIALGSLEYDDGGGFQYFSGAIMQRNFCLLRLGLSMKEACGLFHEDSTNVQPAIQQLVYARTFCNGINVQLKDPKIAEDVVLLETLMENICSECVDPAAQP
ncbi:MAG: hypothetical protein AMXMBFR64_21420 [Myxococcales bacterium]